MKKTIIYLLILLGGTMCKKGQTNTPTPVPVISNISPNQGTPGSIVIISGSNLNAAQSISINGTEAFYKLDNSAQIEAEVPSNAKSGVISIGYEGGSVNSTASFVVLPSPDLSAPIITDILPNNNPIGGPVLIQGTNIDSVKSITFNNISAEIDTNFSGTVTTVVPSGVAAGLVKLTITDKNGVSSTVPFRVVTNYPLYTAPSPSKIMFRRVATYLLRLPNQWINEVNINHSIFIETHVGSPTGFDGGETLNSNFYSMVVTALDETNKTIEITITRGTDAVDGSNINEVYEGQFVDADDPNKERIIFLNSQGRQVVVSVTPQ